MIEIEQFETTESSVDFLRDLRTLLSNAFGDSFTEDDWDHGMGGRHFAVFEERTLVAYCAVVPRTIYLDEKAYSCGYLENVATIPQKRLKGLASAAVREANQFILTHFEISALSTSKKNFYHRLDWKDWSGPSFVLSNGELRNSDFEHGGIMILETGAFPELDLQCRIACEDRRGDAW